MNNKLLKSLRRGIGSAILEIKNTVDKNKYLNEILWCCLHDITYDLQVEGTKGLYLYNAICETGNSAFFEDTIINKYLKSKSERYNIQSSEILLQFVLDGSKKAFEALWQRYNNIFHSLRKRRKILQECSEWEDLAIRLTRVDGLRVVEKYISDIGKLLNKGKNIDQFYFEWFVSAAKDNLGEKKVEKCLFKIKEQPGISIILNHLDIEKKKSLEYQTIIRNPVIYNDYYEKVIYNSKEEKKYHLYGYSRRFAFSSTKEEQELLAKNAIKELDEEIKRMLLLPFKHIDFPLNIDLLFDYLMLDNNDLVEVVIEVLARFKDKKILNIAYKISSVKGLEFALPLFIKNYSLKAEQLIRSFILRKKNINHDLQTNCRDIYENNHSKTCGDILYHIYKNADCAFCRYGLVKSFYKNGIMPEELILECMYDSYDDTQNWAVKIAKKINLI